MRRAPTGRSYQKRLSNGRVRLVLGVCVPPALALTLEEWAADERVSVSRLIAGLLEMGTGIGDTTWKTKKRKQQR